MLKKILRIISKIRKFETNQIAFLMTCQRHQPPLEIDFNCIDQPIGTLKFVGALVQTTFYEDFTFCISEVDFYPCQKRLIPNLQPKSLYISRAMSCFYEA